MSDHGNESAMIAECQTWFYLSAGDQDPGQHHIWTYSTQNVTVESWWRQLRRRCTDFWIRHFQSMEDINVWNGEIIDRWALVAVHLPLIREDLERTRLEHNGHRIRNQRGRVRPGGRPDDMYTLPRLYNAETCGMCVSQNAIDHAKAIFNLNDTPEALPFAVSCLVDRWLANNRITVTRENCLRVYKQVRGMLCAVCSD